MYRPNVPSFGPEKARKDRPSEHKHVSRLVLDDESYVIVLYFQA